MGISRVTINPTHPLIWSLEYVPLTPSLARGPLEDAQVFFGKRLLVSYDYLTNPDFLTSRRISDQKMSGGGGVLAFSRQIRAFSDKS